MQIIDHIICRNPNNKLFLRWDLKRVFDNGYEKIIASNMDNMTALKYQKFYNLNINNAQLHTVETADKSIIIECADFDTALETAINKAQDIMPDYNDDINIYNSKKHKVAKLSLKDYSFGVPISKENL